MRDFVRKNWFKAKTTFWQTNFGTFFLISIYGFLKNSQMKTFLQQRKTRLCKHKGYKIFQEKHIQDY